MIKRMNVSLASRMLVAGFAAMAAGTIPSVAQVSEHTLIFANVGGWAVKADLNREYRCFVEADYDNGSAVRAGFNSDDGRFYLSIGDHSWSWVEVGQEYEVTLAFDEQPPQSFPATGVELETEYVQPGVRLSIPADQAQSVLSEFMYRNEMHLTHGDEVTVTLGLYGTQRASESLQDCQATLAQSDTSTELSQLR